MGSAQASRSARISSSIVNCSRGSRRFPGSLEGERVYEVGPGPGGLTRALLDAGASIVAVERDRRCLPALAELQRRPGAKLEVVEGDALQIDEQALAGEGAHVVANLPYNVGTALLLKWLAAIGRPGGDH